MQAEAAIDVDDEAMLSNTAGFAFPCEGKCKRDLLDITGLYICEICLNLSLCDACFWLVKTKKFPFRLCNSDHSFLQVYPLDGKAEEIAAIEMDGRMKPHQVWLDKLKKEWAT